MADIPTTTAASSRFQAILEAALMSYKRQTNKDRIEHPLASQLQNCYSTRDIIAILQDQVRQFDHYRSGHKRVAKSVILRSSPVGVSQVDGLENFL
jgi:hypothetical protein